MFECLLLFLLFALPKESWLYVEVRNFSLYSHYPLLVALQAFDLLALILIPILMALVWATVFRTGLRLMTRLVERVGVSQRQRILFLRTLACLGLAAVVLAVVDNGNDTPRPFIPSSELKSLVQGQTAFALDLYHKLGDQPGNVFFSPYSIATALALTQAGARGQTEREIATALHFNAGWTNQHVAASEMMRRLADLRRRNRIVLNSANSLWCQRGDPFTSTFLDVASADYRATVEQVDFARDGESARSSINRWIARSTGNRIPYLVSAGQFTPDTSLVLCNAIYFKGQWASPFKRGATKDTPFFLDKDHSVSVPMMNKKANFKTHFFHSDGFAASVLELPYYGKDLSMVVILPEEVDGLAELETHLTADNLRNWLTQLDGAYSSETIVGLPRFKTARSFDLAARLKALGVNAAFDIRAADFSGIDGQNNLYLSTALHSALVEVNEEGTEAAAVTLFQARTRGMAHRFIANHPFLFLIRENATGSVLFLGRVVDPTQ